MNSYNVHRTRFVEFQPKAINSIVYDNDKKLAAFSREDGSIEIRDPVHNWSLVQWIPGKNGRSVESLVWCQGKLFSAGFDGQIYEWDINKLVPLETYDSYGGPVWCLQKAYSSQRLAAACEDGSVRLFTVQHSGLLYKRHFDRQESRIMSLAWNHDDKLLVTGGSDCSIRVYNTNTGHVISRMTTDRLKDRETLVWSINVLSDMTIISGDSLGNVQFWDGRTGTLNQSFKSHTADVLCVCVDKQEKQVFASGVDSKIVKFSLVNSEEGEHKWLCIKHVRATDHDTRSLAFIDFPQPLLVSGGVDPHFVVFPTGMFSSKTKKKYSCLPDWSVCSLAAKKNVLLYKENHKLHLWALEANGMPTKLLEMNCKGGDHMLCYGVSAHANFVAYSTVNSFSLFRLANVGGTFLIEKVKTASIPPASQLCFSANEGQLVVAHVDGKICVYDLTSPDTGLKSIEICVPSSNTPGTWRHMVMSSDCRYVAVYNNACQGHILDVIDQQYVQSIPSIGSRIVYVTFKPSSTNLFILTAAKTEVSEKLNKSKKLGVKREFVQGQSVYEYSIEKDSLLPWCVSLNSSGILSRCFHLANEPIKGVTFNPKDTGELMFWSDETLGKIKYGISIPDVKKDLLKKEKLLLDTDTMKTLVRYTNILYLEFNIDGDLVVVERPMGSILENLPPPLSVKRFGS